MNSGTNAVTVLPPTSAIQDSATRAFADSLVNLLDARSGYTNKDAPERFITAAEFQGLTNRALLQAFAQGGIAPGAGGKDVPSAQEINDSIDNLADFIRKTLVYQLLGEEFGLIDITSLRQKVIELGTGIYKEELGRKTADEQMAGTITTVQAGLNQTNQGLAQVRAGVTAEATARATKDLALASALNTIWAEIGGTQAVIQDGALASATPNSAQATKWNQVQAAVTDPNTGKVNSTSIKQELMSYASNADGKFNSIYSVRAQVSVGGQTLVGGFGLSATAGAGSGQGPTINFGVRADTFFIAATSATPDAATQIGQGSAIPFMVLTTNQVVNGVVYGPGVYLKKAVIGAATIGEAQIADAAITNAKIGDAQITTAKIGQAQIDTLRIQGASVTGIAFGEGGGGTLPAGGTAAVASATLSMPNGSSGAVISSTILMAGQGSASIGLYIYRNGSHVRSVSVSVVDGFYGTFTFSAFDPSPAAGLNTYSLQINNPTAGPGSNRAVDFSAPSITVSGAKR